MSFFGEKLKSLMDSKGIRQQDLAFDTRLDPGNLSKVLNGASPSKTMIQKLAEYGPLGVTEDRLETWKAIDKEGQRLIEAAFIELHPEMSGMIQEYLAKVSGIGQFSPEMEAFFQSEMKRRKK